MNVSARNGLVRIEGGSFKMGSDRFYPEEGPPRDVRIDAFSIASHTVTNVEYSKFVRQTGYVTVAERPPNPADFPGAPPENLVPGSVVFHMTPGPVDLRDFSQWWSWVPGTSWKHPYGPGSSIDSKPDHPVVQVAYEDAEAYARWAGKRLPTEAEWEFAARGGLTGKPYVWGDEFRPGGKWMANTFQGQFPTKDTGEDHYVGISGAARFPANRYGLYDMAGNVWQWTSDWYRPDYYRQLVEAGGVARNPRGPDAPYDPSEPNERKKTHRGGSFLCTDQYCSRYMVGTRGKGEVSTGTNHLGFRCVKEPSSHPAQ